MENSIDLLLLLLTRDPEIMDGEENKNDRIVIAEN